MTAGCAGWYGLFVGVTVRCRADLFERQSELEQIAALLDRATDGEGSTLVIEGPAGIGKTELLAHARQMAAERKMEVLTAFGGELERDLSFVVVRDLLARRIAQAPDSERRELMAGAAGLAAPLIGVATGGDDRAATRGELLGAALSAALHGLFWLCSNLADRRPLFLAVDDVHWADPGSLRFFSYLAHRIRDLPALLILSRRTGEHGTDEEIMGAIRVAPAATAIQPSPLSPEAVAEILEATYQERPEDEFVIACHGTTGGNPFFIRELVATLREEGLGPHAEYAARVHEMHPGRIASAVRARLERLPPSAIELARAVAVLGTEVELRNAANLAGIDEGGAAADLLAAAELLESRRPLAFRHPIIRSAIYDAIPHGRRAADHARAARQLAQEAAPSEPVATHLLHTERLGDPWVVDVLRDAARSAVERGAPESASTYLRRALVEPPHGEARVHVLTELGAAELTAGDARTAEEHLSEAFALSDQHGRAAIAVVRVVALNATARHDDAVAMLQQVIPEVAPASPDTALQLEAAMLSSASLSSEAYQQPVDLMARLNRLRGATAGERLLLANGAWYSGLFEGRAEEAVRFARRALADGHLLTEARVEAPPFWLCTAMVLAAEHHDEHLAWLEQAQREAARQGSIIGMALVRGNRAVNSYQRGLIGDAVEDARDAVRDTLAANWMGGLPLSLGVLVLSLVERGDLAEGERVLRDQGMAGEVPRQQLFDILLIARGALRLAQGLPDTALDDLKEVGRRQGRRRMNSAFSVFAWRPAAAHSLAATGDRAGARGLAEEHLRIARRWGTPGPIAAGLRAVAASEQGDARVALLHEAVSLLETSDAGLEKMHALLDLGSTLRRLHPSSAREPLSAALDLAERAGAGLVAERARAELSASGITRRKRTFLAGVEALTPSERRVASMAAKGMTNPQIGQALFVTRKTVEKHLANAYLKLGITSRDQLSVALGPGLGTADPNTGAAPA